MGENNKERRAGIRWDNVVEKKWKDFGGDQEEVQSIDREVWRVQEDRSKIKERRMGKASAKE